MATSIWRGGAASVAQVDTYTPGGTIAATDTFTLTLTADDGETAAVTFTATTTTVSHVTAGLVAAWNASANPLLTGITAADATTALTLTADTAGVPFSVAASVNNVSGGAAPTLTQTLTTASSGPNDMGLAANWTSTAVPGSGDDMYFPAGAPSALYRLDQTATTKGKIVVMDGFAGNIGRFEGGKLYHLRAPCSDLNIRGSGSLVAIDIGASAISAIVAHSGVASVTGRQVVYPKGSAMFLDVRAGVVGVATHPGVTTTLTNLYVSGGTVVVGPGTTVSGIVAYVSGGAAVSAYVTMPSVYTFDANTTYRQMEGVWTTGTFRGGVAYPNATGTYATTNVTYPARIDDSELREGRTFTNTNVYGNEAAVALGLRIIPDENTNVGLTYTNKPVYA